jgi:hypothetical protein
MWPIDRGEQRPELWFRVAHRRFGAGEIAFGFGHFTVLYAAPFAGKWLVAVPLRSHHDTNDDKRCAADIILGDPEWANREIARLCSVDEASSENGRPGFTRAPRSAPASV